MDFLAGEKRPADRDGLDVREVKRVKRNVKKVAEMVLVLSGLGKMRGGIMPSEAERDLMVEAREKLVEVCQEFAPKDVFPLDGFGCVIEDLGFGDQKEQRLGFRPQKMSISEKLLLSKRKFQLEEAEEFALPSPTSSQKFQGPAINALERRGLSQQVQVTPQVKSLPVSIPPASLQPAPAGTFSHVAATKPTAVPYQLPIGEVRSTISIALPSSHVVKDSPSFPPARIDRPSVKVDGRPTSSSHASQVQVQAHSSRNQTTTKTTAWPLQPQPVSSTQMAPENNVPLQSLNVDGTMKSGIAPQSTITKPVTNQVATVASRMRNTHSEIANMVQKLLQRYVEPPVWTPPSRDYLNRPWPCQMCQSPVTDADSLLICDNCEKGYHLKCLQTANHKRAAKGEWHCFRCLYASHGKPIPPKYGRVMRNTNNNKILSNTASVRPSPDRKTATVDDKPNLQKVSSNGNNSMQSVPSASTGNNYIHPILQSTQNASAMQKNEIVSCKGEMDGKHSLETCPNNSTGDHVVVSRKFEEDSRLVDVKSNSVADSEKVLNTGSLSQQLDQRSNVKGGLQNCVELPSVQSVDNHITVTYSSQHCGSEAASQSNKEPNGEVIGVLRVNHVEPSKTTSSNWEASNSSSNHCDVWVGTVLEVADEKVYYKSCCINGVVYKINDYVLVRFEHGKLIPSKLQVMWEDCQTKSKWFTVNSCYFPSDLPEAVGRPCGLESNEVYGSTRESTITSSLIQGPCDVLSQNKFEAEKERRSSSGIEGPYYLCRWIYDETKGSFREVSY